MIPCVLYVWFLWISKQGLGIKDKIMVKIKVKRVTLKMVTIQYDEVNYKATWSVLVHKM